MIGSLMSVLLGAAVLSILLVEVALSMPFPTMLRMMAQLSRRSVTIPRRHASDHWKQRALLLCSLRMVRVSIALLACVVVLGGLAAFGIMILGVLMPGFQTALLSGFGLVAITLIALMHLALRRQLAHV
ncbi:hypothetical protein GLS40_06945 [Pseudooceanicola sp. 216_PA32_1]|uniref:Uncharacterized protein n=1 Tax=Pseudooceanicola pacificus TaxID=2676438 RepID=A0A844W0Z4_9RHOB|nr:hypothetical protein [Pseudooceanicola pacificus]MWB77756.1 hypothetical protein [Pseudooceanicola pacificus]